MRPVRVYILKSRSRLHNVVKRGPCDDETLKTSHLFFLP
ncbi:hypothetical protein SAMN05444173_2729 [Opitutus sp. GAS368]|nr:hypothetical protein SAMN05444173_2729 [Opitutus sp. GAS368]